MIPTIEQVNEISKQTGKKYIICVDFDHTLCNSKFPECGEPIKAIVDYILYIQEANIEIILWTCRTGEPLTKAVDWCKEQGIRLDAVNEQGWYDDTIWEDSRKVFCNLLIDDTSYSFNVRDFEIFMNVLRGNYEKTKY